MVNLNFEETAHFMLWPNQFQKNCQIKTWYYRMELTNPLRSYNGLFDGQTKNSTIGRVTFMDIDHSFTW